MVERVLIITVRGDFTGINQEDIKITGLPDGATVEVTTAFRMAFAPEDEFRSDALPSMPTLKAIDTTAKSAC